MKYYDNKLGGDGIMWGEVSLRGNMTLFGLVLEELFLKKSRERNESNNCGVRKKWREIE